MILLECAHVSMRLDGEPVLDDVSLQIGSGELVGLLGPNGAGKTSLMRTSLGLLNSAGDIKLGGEPITRLTAIERAKRASYVPQNRAIAWPMSVETLIGLGRYPHRTSPDADRLAVSRAIAQMSLEAFRDRPATRLSGGEATRVLIARALAQEAPLLVADEPLAGLDPAHSISLLDTLRRLTRNGQGILVSLHDLGAAMRWCDRILLLNQGNLVADGAPRDVLNDARLRDVFGITAHRASDHGGNILVPTGLSNA